MKVAILAVLAVVALASAAPTKLTTQEYMFQFELYQRQFNKVCLCASFFFLVHLVIDRFFF